MSTTTKQVIDLMEILPESEQNFALEFIKKLVLAWDPDFTKLTPMEQLELSHTTKSTGTNEKNVLHSTADTTSPASNIITGTGRKK